MASRKCRQQGNKKRRIYVRDNGHCHYCNRLCLPFGTATNKPASATLDHIQTRQSGGGNHDENLVLACYDCNNSRTCIPYYIFLNERLWMPENKQRLAQVARLFSLGAHSVVLNKKSVWLLEMYHDDGHVPSVQNWGVFATSGAVQRYIKQAFPEAIRNEDDDLGYIGFHFPEDHILEAVSFVANSWDTQE